MNYSLVALNRFAFQIMILSFLSFISFNCFSEEVDVLTIESSLEQRLTRIIKSVDEQGYVIVKVTVKKKSTQLPGLTLQSVNIFQPGLLQKIELGSINEIKIKVITSLDKLPEWVEKQIQQSAEFGQTKMDYSVSKLITPQSKTIDLLQRLSDGWKETLNQQFEKSYIGFIGSSLSLIVAIIILSVSLIFSLRKSFKDQIEAIKESSMNSNDNTSSSFKSSNNIQDNLKSNNNLDSSVSSRESSSISQMSNMGLKALFADCYWSVKDQYASWIWMQMSDEQRMMITQDLSFGYQYAQFIYTQEPQQGSFHTHPVYTQPLDFFNISNQDLKSLIIKQPQLWNMISELRQNSIDFSLKQRIEILNKAKNLKTNANLLKDIQIPQSHHRILEQTFGDIFISQEDEEYLLNHPQSLNEMQKKSIWSLVWLAQLSLDKQQVILAQFSAEDLAHAWVGHPQILETIKLALPEKKYKLMIDFTQQIRAERKSWQMRQICQMSLNLKQEDKSSYAA